MQYFRVFFCARPSILTNYLSMSFSCLSSCNELMHLLALTEHLPALTQPGCPRRHPGWRNRARHWSPRWCLQNTKYYDSEMQWHNFSVSGFMKFSLPRKLRVWRKWVQIKQKPKRREIHDWPNPETGLLVEIRTKFLAKRGRYDFHKTTAEPQAIIKTHRQAWKQGEICGWDTPSKRCWQTRKVSSPTSRTAAPSANNPTVVSSTRCPGAGIGGQWRDERHERDRWAKKLGTSKTYTIDSDIVRLESEPSEYDANA